MNSQIAIVMAAIIIYLVWLIIFVLAIEPGIRRLVGWLFGVSISREIQQYSGPSSNLSVLDLFDAYRWKVDQPASLALRFGVGLFRVGFWAMAVVFPLAIGIGIFLIARR